MYQRDTLSAKPIRKAIAFLLVLGMLFMGVPPVQSFADSAVPNTTPTKLTGFDAYTDHSGAVYKQINASTGAIVNQTDDMKFHITVHFNGAVSIVNATALLSELSIRLNNAFTLTSGAVSADYSTRYAEISPGTDGKSLEFTLHVGYAPFSGLVEMTAPAAGLTQLTDSNGKPIAWQDIKFFMPNGVKLKTISQTAAIPLKNTNASVTKEVIAPSTCTRAMMHMLFLKNGQPVGALNTYGCNYTGHYHDYLNLNAEKFTALIPGWFNNAFGTDYSIAVNGDEFTITAKNSSKGDVIDFRMFVYPQDRDTKADKIALNALITQASACDSTKYTPATYNVMRNELYIAKSMADSPYYLQSEIDAEAAALQKAVDALVPGIGEADTDTGTDTVTTSAAAGVFSDVPAGHWAAESITYLVTKDVINGKTKTSFAPGDKITRAEFVKILAGAAGAKAETVTSPDFSDVLAGAWYAPYVEWAYSAGIATKSEAYCMFHPNAPITRQDMAVMIARYVEDVKKTTLPAANEAAAFADHDQIAAYAADSVAMMQKAGIITGKGNNRFAPLDNATRAEAAKTTASLMQMLDMLKQ